jgi:hypothetical protein
LPKGAPPKIELGILGAVGLLKNTIVGAVQKCSDARRAVKLELQERSELEFVR